MKKDTFGNRPFLTMTVAHMHKFPNDVILELEMVKFHFSYAYRVNNFKWGKVKLITLKQLTIFII